MTKLQLTTYQKICSEYYDLEQHPNGESAASFYMDYAMQANGPILEPMCGTGRFLLPMLEAGLDAEGFDASIYMLQAFEQKYASISHNPAPVWQQFVQDFNVDKQYKLIFVPYGSWGLITDLEHSKKGLESMYRHLAPSGKFIIEIDTVASVSQSCGIWHRSVRARSNNSYIALNMMPFYDSKTQIFQAKCRYESIVQSSINEIETENFQMYLYKFDEMDQLLKRSGFTQIKKYKDHAKNPAIDLNTPMIIYECIK